MYGAFSRMPEAELAFAQTPAMLARVFSAAVNGIEAFPVEVEINSGWGDTVIVIVGLSGVAVKESKDRVSTALTNSGFKFPMGRTTVNLARRTSKRRGLRGDRSRRYQNLA
jgi:magnesium chelatase family protein